MNDESRGEPLRLSRRGAVKTAAGVAAAGTVLAVSARTPAEAATATTAVPAAQAPAQSPAADLTGDQIVVHVRNLRTGELAFYLGEREVTVYDRDLAARLAAATR
ncbi:MAG TPA: hypothetical protein VGX23_14980 [Actinocrinis sp.]|nr:hypothetical protein [Actinocrinis sp.]